MSLRKEQVNCQYEFFIFFFKIYLNQVDSSENSKMKKVLPYMYTVILADGQEYHLLYLIN